MSTFSKTFIDVPVGGGVFATINIASIDYVVEVDGKTVIMVRGNKMSVTCTAVDVTDRIESAIGL